MRLGLVLVMLIFSTVGCSKAEISQDNRSNSYSAMPSKTLSRGSNMRVPPVTAVFNGSEALWLINSTGDLLITKNGGTTWSTISGDSMEGFDLVSFADEDTGWAISKAGILWKTENGGTTWIQNSVTVNSASYPFVSPEAIRFSDKLHGWLIKPFEVLKSIDGGKSWELVALPTNSPYHFYSLFTNDPDRVWIGGDGILFSTQNGGQTWTEISLAGREVEFATVSFLDEVTGYVIGLKGELFRTNDGGKNWGRKIFSNAKTDWHIYSVQFASAMEGWAVGSSLDSNIPKNKSGVILHTTDGGDTWAKVDISHDEENFELVYFANPSNGWLLSSNKVYKTVNSGKSWKVVLRFS